MAQKYSREMDNFGQCALRQQSRMTLKYYGFGTCIFGHRESFDRLEAIASLDAYQITNYQFLSKTHHFLLPDSEKFKKKFLNREFYGQLPEQA